MDIKPVSRFRSVSSQFIACMAPNLLLMNLGMAISYVTIVVPALLNAQEGLSLNENQASWFGSLSYLMEPLGALVSGPMVNYFGRKKAIFLVNFPHIVAWILMYISWDLPSLFIGNALLGLGCGIMEAPINSYVGEVSDPAIRGTICMATLFFSSTGILTMYFLGTVVTWRNAAAVALILPAVSMVFTLLVPETPVWLLSKGREEDALKSLCFLRGWTTPDLVKNEFNLLRTYTQNLHKCVVCKSSNEKEVKGCQHEQLNYIKRLILKFRYVILGQETTRPLTLLILYFTSYVLSGLTPVRPNMVNVCRAFGMPGDARNIVVMVGVLTLASTVIVVCTIKYIGKRKLAITSLFLTGLTCTGLSLYAKTNLEESVFSYDTSTFPEETSYIPLVMFYLLTVFTGFGVPWVLLGEIFPFRSRSTAQGISAAANYVITFIGAKTFISLETNIHLWGSFAVYAIFSFLGTIHLYFFLPETEGKSLEEIEYFFQGNYKTFADDAFINLFKKK